MSARWDFLVSSEIALTSESLGSLFTIPESDWTQISKRVGLAILARDISAQIARYLPDFPALVTVSESWKDRTFPGLVAQSASLPSYCVRARGDFSGLQQRISGLDPGKPLPPALKQEAETVIGRLAESSAPLAQAFRGLAVQVGEFTSVNQRIDAKIKSYTDRLGPDWKSIDPAAGAVSRATGLVLGAWLAISSDLSAVVSGRIPVTTPLLLGLGIASALLAWENVQREAEEFGRIAKGQERYLSGQWLGNSASAGDPDKTRHSRAPLPRPRQDCFWRPK
jgi:hypothetical protein